jgi:hypothetical protein
MPHATTALRCSAVVLFTQNNPILAAIFYPDCYKAYTSVDNFRIRALIVSEYT